MNEQQIITSFMERLESHVTFLRTTLEKECVDYTVSLDLLRIAFQKSVILFPEKKEHFEELEGLVTQYKTAQMILKSYKRNDLVSFRDVIEIAMSMSYTKEETKELSAAMLHRNCNMIENRFHTYHKREENK